MTRDSINVTRDWSTSRHKPAIIKLTTYKDGVVNAEKEYKQ